MHKHTRFQRTCIARALALLCTTALLPAGAAVITAGDFTTTDPGGSFAAGVSIGPTAAGQFTVNGGSLLEVARLGLGGGATGDGALTVTGAGSRTFVTFASGGNLDLGGQGKGSIALLEGGRLDYGGAGNNCQLNCRIFISNGAGSSGELLVSGAGSALATAGAVVVGQASMFTLAADGNNYGTPGGASTGQAQLLAGGRAESSFIAVAQPGGGTARTGNESATGSLVIDGAASVWRAVRNAAQTGGRSLLAVATGRNTTGTVDVRSGGQLLLNGSAAAGEFSGINIASIAAGATSSNARGSLNVTGAGSKVQAEGGIGFINVGRGNGMTGALNISSGGVLAGAGVETGLIYATVGNGGGTGTADISGAGSLLRLNGRNSATNSDTTSQLNGGAFLSVGRSGGGAGGQGTMNISGGGQVVIDTLGLQLANANGQTGMYLGFGAGSNGTMNVTGSGSRLDIKADSGMAPYVAIGRDGASGTLNITGGGRVELSSTHVSVPNLGTSVYLPGDVQLLEIGRRNAGTDNNATTGVVNVTGAGSALVLGGGADSLLIVGRGNGGAGQLNINAGGTVRTTSILIGQEAGSNGVVNINGGTLVADGLLNGGPSAGLGGGVAVGRGGGTGTLNVAGGALLTIGSTFSGSSLSAAGSGTAPGGNGFINISGGSTVTVNGPNAVVSIGRVSSATAAGVGQMTLSGAGTSLAANGENARVLIGGMANTSGTVIVGSGATLSATTSVGVAHDTNGQTVGTGTLIVDGAVNSTKLINGSNGYVGGSGVINADVLNFGVLNPGQSPGLTINGSLENRSGTIVLEVQSLGSGLFDVDEIVLGDPTQALLDGGVIQFQFLGNTNPLTFLNAGLFDIDTFFKEVDGTGAVVGLGGTRLGLFDGVRYSATSATYGITNFAFSAANGASFGVTAVPAPATLALALLALAALGLSSRRRRCLG